MPHIILEYSREHIADDALPAILDRLEKSVAGCGLFECANIKIRCIPVRHYRLGTGESGFIHVQCRIHQGRSQEQRLLLSGGIVDALKKHDTGVSVITCEVVEMDSQSYAKWAL